MIVDGKNRRYTTLKSPSKLLMFSNRTSKGTYHFCINFLNDFSTVLARQKHYEYRNCNGHVKVRMPSKNEKWLKFHEEYYQFKDLLTLCTDFEEILKPVDEKYREKMNKMKTERKDKISYRKKIRCTIGMVCAQHVCSWRCT